MQCQQAHELFSDYIERTLDAALTVSVDNHLTACANCREEMAGLRRLWSRLDTMPAVEPPTALHTNLLAALDAETAQQRELQVAGSNGKSGRQMGGGILSDLRSLFRPRALAFAAGLAIIVLGGIGVKYGRIAGFPSLFTIFQKSGDSPAPRIGTSVNTAGTSTIPAPPASGTTSAPTISANKSELALNSDGTSTLTVELQSDTTRSGTVSPLDYTAELVEGDDTENYQASAVRANTQGKFESTGKATVTLTLKQQPVTGVKLSLVLKLTDQNTDAQKVVVPLDLKSGQ